MNNPDSSSASKRSERQHQAREEWRRLCDAMEQAQGDELARECHNRYQFVRTYQVYGSKFNTLLTKLKRAAQAGDYEFFRERGVPVDILDWRFAEQLLNDWHEKVQGKKRRLASIYQLKYGEPLVEVARTDEEAFQMNSVEPLHDSDALLQLSGMSRPSFHASDVESLRNEIDALKSQLQDLTRYVHDEFKSLQQRLKDR